MSERHSIRSAAVVCIRRFDTLVASAALLGLCASASVEEASLGQAEFGGGSLLVADVVGVGFARAAAAAEEPEEGGEEDEGGGEPGYGKHVGGQADLDTVVLELLMQGRYENAEHDCGCNGASENEDGGDDGADPGEEAAEARADGEDTEHNGDDQGP